MHSFDFFSAILAFVTTVLVIYAALRKLGYRLSVRLERVSEPRAASAVEDDRLPTTSSD